MAEQLKVGDQWLFHLPSIHREIPVGTMLEVISAGRHRDYPARTGFDARVIKVPGKNEIVVNVPKGTKVVVNEI